MVKNENFIMQAKESKTLQELNLTDDFLFDVATEELENCKAIIELTTGLRLKSLKWKSGQKVIHNLPGKRGVDPAKHGSGTCGRYGENQAERYPCTVFCGSK